MKIFEQLALRARSRSRRTLARYAPGRASVRPASITVRIDGLDAPPAPLAGAASDELAGGLDGLQARFVALVMETGPVPVRVVGRSTNALLVEVVRFCWRLECPVLLRTDAAGIDDGMALALVDAGLRRVELVAGGSDVAAEAAVTALVGARKKRDARLDIVVERATGRGFVDAAGALRAAGADGVRLAAPWAGAAPEGRDEVAEWKASANRTEPGVLAALGRFDGAGPGAARAGGACAVGGERLELGPDGRIASCPFQEGAVVLGEDAAAAIDALGPHRERIRACGRECVHGTMRP